MVPDLIGPSWVGGPTDTSNNVNEVRSNPCLCFFLLGLRVKKIRLATTPTPSLILVLTSFYGSKVGGVEVRHDL